MPCPGIEEFFSAVQALSGGAGGAAGGGAPAGGGSGEWYSSPGDASGFVQHPSSAPSGGGPGDAEWFNDQPDSYRFSHAAERPSAPEGTAWAEDHSLIRNPDTYWG